MFEKTKALSLLSEGFKKDFAMNVFESDRFDELLMDLSEEFVNKNIPLVDEEDSLELALLLKESIMLGNY